MLILAVFFNHCERSSRLFCDTSNEFREFGMRSNQFPDVGFDRLPQTTDWPNWDLPAVLWLVER